MTDPKLAELLNNIHKENEPATPPIVKSASTFVITSSPASSVSINETKKEEISKIEKSDESTRTNKGITAVTQRSFMSGRLKGKGKSKTTTDAAKTKAEILAQYGGLESNIPVSSSYWKM